MSAWGLYIATSEGFCGVCDSFFAALSNFGGSTLLLLLLSVSVGDIAVENDSLLVYTLSVSTLNIVGFIAVLLAMSLVAFVIVIDILDISNACFGSSGLSSYETLVDASTQLNVSALATAFVAAGLSQLVSLKESVTSLLQRSTLYSSACKEGSNSSVGDD
jgi:hypothetical protein